MNYILLLRPRHWIKNFLVFIPLFFAKEFLNLDKLFLACITFIIFSLIASAVYILNDIIDAPQDRLHPLKQHRPIASQKIPVFNAVVLVGLLLICASVLIKFYVISITWLFIVYVCLNFAYSLFLKHISIVDLLLISFFYFLRIEAGGQAIDTPISSWLILCTIFFSLFVIIAKRKAELTHTHKRKVLEHYNDLFLDHLLTVSAAFTLVSYGIYTVLGPVPHAAVYSNFFVVLGLFRYLQIVYTTTKSERPERLVLDPMIISSFILWLGYMSCIFYVV